MTFFTVLHVVDRSVWNRSVFNQYSYYRGFFCLGPALNLRDLHNHVWERYIDTTIITVWCMSSILIHITSLIFGIANIYYLWVIFQNGKTEYNYFKVISIIAKPFFLIEKWNLKYHLFLNSQQVIGTNWKIYKSFLALFFYLQVSRLKQLVYVCIGQPTGWELCARYWLRA